MNFQSLTSLHLVRPIRADDLRANELGASVRRGNDLRAKAYERLNSHRKLKKYTIINQLFFKNSLKNYDKSKLILHIFIL